MSMDTALYGLRWLQYLSLMLLAGLPWLQWQAGHFARRTGAAVARLDARGLRRLLLACLAFAVVAQLVEIPLKLAHMLALPPGELDADTLRWFVLETPAGLAWVARTALLAACAVPLCLRRGAQGFPARGFALLASACLLTLMWNGHAAASSGWAGIARLALAGLHLLAAAAWLGAVAGFIVLLRRPPDAGTRDGLHLLLHLFAGSGSVLVLALLATGIGHYIWIQDGALSPATLLATPYGRWMLLKLALFVLLLGLAALHRWRLVPRLGKSHDEASRTALGRSLWAEAVLMAAVIACVSILGTMSPHG